ncbi:MAG: alpha/beta hydrolase [Spirochaetes bacterium]|nr:alpha/beta hydrolase [Spirochaetota bacterium]HXK65971.1 alpha/beta hydrolase [Spirochaetota bacterium]
MFSVIRGMLFFTLIALTTGCSSLGMRNIPLDELKPKYANDASRFILINDTIIHIRDEGKKDGPVLLLIHGVCASLHTWDGWVEILKDHFRIIRFDIPGFGLSGQIPSNNYTPEYSVDLLNKAIEHMGIKKLSIAGNSLGGFIAWKFAITHPDKVEKLILIDSVGYPQEMPWLLKFSTNIFVRPFARIGMPRYFINKAVHEVYGDQSKVTDAIVDRYFELSQKEGNRSAWIDVFMVMKDYSKRKDLSKGLTDIQCPIMVMWGTKDIWIPYTTEFPKWQKDLPHAVFKVYEGVGHIPMEEIPEQTAKDAFEFLTGKKLFTAKQ